MLLDIKSWPQHMATISFHCDNKTTMFNVFSKIFD